VGRAGAVEQMQTYADALDTRFWAVEEPREVAQIMRQERPKEGIILDTPGVSPFASADVNAVRAFRESLGAEMILVIPASGDVGEHTDWITAFADLGVRRCIITKFDASRRIGAAVSACHQAGMAIAYFSEAPFIADGLIEAGPDYLAQRLLMDVPGRLGRKSQ
jgi:flagellar biosynthesis protein FlhF